MVICVFPSHSISDAENRLQEVLQYYLLKVSMRPAKSAGDIVEQGKRQRTGSQTELLGRGPEFPPRQPVFFDSMAALMRAFSMINGIDAFRCCKEVSVKLALIEYCWCHAYDRVRAATVRYPIGDDDERRLPNWAGADNRLSLRKSLMSLVRALGVAPFQCQLSVAGSGHRTNQRLTCKLKQFQCAVVLRWSGDGRRNQRA